MSQPAISAHYDAVPEQSHDQRNARRTINVDNFQNSMKARLIEDYGPDSCNHILDLACGKAADYWKFQSTYPSHKVYAGLDLSSNSITAAHERLRSRRNQAQVYLGVADMTLMDSWHHIPPPLMGTFDLVNVQFALHYACDNNQNLHQLLSNMGQSLRPGGVALGITLSSVELVRRWQSHPMIGNSLYYVEWDGSKGRPTEWHTNNTGHSYMFHLDNRVHLQEYLVPFDTLSQIAVRYGLQLKATHEPTTVARSCFMQLFGLACVDQASSYDWWKHTLQTHDPRHWLYDQLQNIRTGVQLSGVPAKDGNELVAEIQAHNCYRLVSLFASLSTEELEVVTLYKTFVFCKQ